MSDRLIVSAAEANRSFSRLLRAACDGRRITITSHGRPVAELGPVSVDAAAERARRLAALAEMEARWAGSGPTVVGPWSRSDLYDRGGR